MPFKLRLKKSRQYNVVSKSLFVCGVELLDGGSLECTLGSESTGRDCLDNVCQRLGLNQPDFFGLQYVPKSTEKNSGPRWLEMERPVKRQLDKYSVGPQLLLRVMFYITSSVSNLLTDETSRYHYFLQLKMDVIEGRIATTAQQAVLLASYSMQAEFGNYDSERHTTEYLKDFQLFPKHLIEESESGIQGAARLTEAALLQHAALRGLPSATAEERYIAACQCLPGYGRETFYAFIDDKKKHYLISVSLDGIAVSAENDESEDSKFYPWKEIRNVINNKRYFIIEHPVGNRIERAVYQFEDANSAKHVWRMCVHQHTFHQRLQAEYNLSSQSYEKSLTPAITFERVSTEEKLTESRETLPHTATYSNDRTDSVTTSYSQLVESSAPSLSQRAQSTSCLDLTTTADIERLRALLPSYRPAPDYETAIRQKYCATAVLHQDSAFNHDRIMQAQIHHSALYSSQPEIRQPEAYTARLHYPDVTPEHSAAVIHPLYNTTLYDTHLKTSESEKQLEPHYVSDLVEGMHFLHLYKPPPPYPSNRLSSNSTPDLAVASQTFNIPVRSFTGVGHVSGSSPDLVSTRTFLTGQYPKHLVSLPYEHSVRHDYLSNAHGTYENLASILDNKHYIYDATQRSGIIVNNTSLRKVYDEHGNIIYCVPALLEGQPYGSPSFVVTHKQSDSSEPIYENVPVSWQNKSAMRERTQSVQSAPEMLPILDRRLINAMRVHPQSSAICTRSKTSDIIENVYANVQNQKVMPNSMSNQIHANAKKASLIMHNDTHFGTGRENEAYFQAVHEPITKTSQENIYVDAIVQDGINVSSKEERNDLLTIPSTHKNSMSNIHTSLFKNSSHDVNTSSKNSLADTKANSFKVQNVSQNFNSSFVTNSLQNINGSESACYLNRSETIFSTSPKSTDKYLVDDSESVSNVKIETGDAASINKLYEPSLTSGCLMADISQNSICTISSKEKKRRRWGLLGGRSKSSEKVKSATLGREKSKDKLSMEQKERHRWSTGLPRLQPLPPTISKETMCQLLERKLSDSQLFFEFEKIPKKKLDANFTTALHPDNGFRNRFKDVLPYEENRVRLIPTRENKHGYVNASHVTASVGNKQRFYIAAQGPTQATVEDFWHCVWQADVYLIVQLTTVQEDLYYIPLNEQRCITIGPYQIWSEFSQSSETCSTSKLRVCNSDSRHYRSIWHLTYGAWGDQGCPIGGPTRFLSFLEELRSVREHSVAQDVPPNHNRNPPTLVHCTAGVGRTGVTVLADLLLYTLDHNQELDVPRTVGLLRHQRAHMVQTVAQYRFVYSLLIHYLKQTRLI